MEREKAWVRDYMGPPGLGRMGKVSVQSILIITALGVLLRGVVERTAAMTVAPTKMGFARVLNVRLTGLPTADLRQ
jgi:hypothetical protein